MKRLFYITSLLIISISAVSQNIQFEKYFVNKTLRLDYMHAGNSDTAYIYFVGLYEEPYWGGSHKNLIDTFNYGQYKFEVFDEASGKLLYSRGYSTLFQEWQDTPEAKKIDRSFYESIVMPFPKNPIIVKILQIDKQNNYHSIFSYKVDPSNMFIHRELSYEFKTYDLIKNGDPANKLDIVMLAEGYTKKEMKKYKKDVEKYINYLLTYEPFKSRKDDINVHVVLSYSPESGTDMPGIFLWKNTLFNTSFWTFGTERYLTTEDFKTVRDVAALVPYDQIYILVNTSKYGGGGIYNFFNLCVADNPMAPDVFVHEFGHGFGGLADEYDYGDDSNQDRYDLTVEPPEPNITTLVDFAAKWQDMVPDTVPIPTPAIRKYYDAIGVYEGAGYVKNGVYRPSQHCLMRALGNRFCPVCQRAISKMLDFYAD